MIHTILGKPASARWADPLLTGSFFSKYRAFQKLNACRVPILGAPALNGALGAWSYRRPENDGEVDNCGERYRIGSLKQLIEEHLWRLDYSAFTVAAGCFSVLANPWLCSAQVLVASSWVGVFPNKLLR